MHSCYYATRNCKYFVDNECYENYTSLYDASTCSSAVSGYFSNGRCYYRAQRNCTAGHYLQQCTCYPHRNAMYSSSTCYNIDGYYNDSYCYYTQFNCRGGAVNGQCYRRVTTACTPCFIQAVRVATQCAPTLSFPRGRPSASCAAEQTRCSSTFPCRICSHADRCTRLMR